MQKLNSVLNHAIRLVIIRWITYALVLVGMIYWTRVTINQLYDQSIPYSLRDGFSTLINTTCAIPIATLSIITTIIVTAITALRRSFVVNNATPAVTLLIGILVGLVLPLPPLPPLPLETYFFNHRADYEYVAELALAGELPAGNCGDDLNSYRVPAAYEHLSDQCIEIVSLRYGNVILFDFTFPYVGVIYVESIYDMDSVQYCHGEGRLMRQLDSHWLICFYYPEDLRPL